MIRTLTVFSSILLLAHGATNANRNEGQTVLGVFQRVHTDPHSTVSTPTLIIQQNRAILRKSTNDSSDISTDDPHRIVGGQQISISQVPWQAALIQDRNFVCGASVISTIWVLTAGHCVFGFGNSSFVVRAGSDSFRVGGQARRVGFMAVHGQYNAARFNYDVAMLKVTRRFTFGTNLQPVRLPTRSTRLPRTFVISGWGSTSESSSSPTRRLRGVSVNLVNRRTCARQYASSVYTINANMICASASGRDACQGDSGGAVVNGGIQYGIVSFGIGCAQSQYPGVNTNVIRMTSWILGVARTFSRSIDVDDYDESGRDFKLVMF